MKAPLKNSLSLTLATSFMLSSLLLPATVQAAVPRASKAICDAIIANETRQIEVLQNLNKDLSKSAKVRTTIDKVAGTAEAIDAVDALGRFAKSPDAAGAIDALASIVGSYQSIKAAKDEKAKGASRAMTIDEMIQFRQALVANVQHEEACAVDLYASSIANIVREQVGIQTASIEALNKLIAGVEKQKNTAAYYFAGIGAVGIAYTAFTWQTSYFVKTFLIGGVSLAFVGGGVVQIVIDQTTLAPVLNELKTTRDRMVEDRAKAVTQLENLAGAKLN